MARRMNSERTFLKDFRMQWEKSFFVRSKSDRDRSFARLLAYDYFDLNTGMARVSDKKIAEKLGRSSDTIMRARKSLEESGFIKSWHGCGRSNVTRYQLVLPSEPEHSPPKGPQIDVAHGVAKGRTFAPKGPQNCSAYIKEQPNLIPRHPRRAFASKCIPDDDLKLIEQWNDWLNARGYPTLLELNFRLQSQDGFEMPLKYPPQENDAKGVESVVSYIELRRRDR